MRNRLNTMELLMSTGGSAGQEEEMMSKTGARVNTNNSSSSSRSGNHVDEHSAFLASPSRCRPVPRRVRVRQATAAAAAVLGAALAWVCWAARLGGEAVLRCCNRVLSGIVSGSRPKGCSVVGLPQRREGRGESRRLFAPSSPGVLPSLESGLGGDDDPWRETWRRHEQMMMQEAVEQQHQQPQHHQQHRNQQLQEARSTSGWEGGGGREAGLLLPLPMVPASKPTRGVEASPSPSSTQASSGHGAEDSGEKAPSAGGATAPASPAEFDDIVAALDVPSPAGGVEEVVLTGGQGSCCGLCGYTLEEGQRVVRSPACSEGLMLHHSCFDESGVVFRDEADGGSLKFGCDCGQFHSGEGLDDGLYAFRSPDPSECSSVAGTPRSAAGWGLGRGMMAASPRQNLRQQARTSALEACPVFLQADPQALAIVDGEVELRPMAGATGASAAAAADLHLAPDDLAERFRRQDVLSRAEAGQLLQQGTAVLDGEANVLELEGETVVVGDLHGQFFDLLNLLSAYGKPPDRQYLFLGDYVDRGLFSCEVALYLIALKVAFPRKVYLIRGNHETANQTTTCGFKEECFSKYGSEIYGKFLECFCALPVCAILSQDGQSESLFCVHGGLSPRLRTVDDVRLLERRMEPEEGTLLADLLWSDPSDDPSVKRAALRDRTNNCCSSVSGGGSGDDSGVSVSAAAGGTAAAVATEAQATTGEIVKGSGFAPNLVRGCSWSYGWDAVEAFLKANSFRGILRAHSVQGEGYHHHFQGHCAPSGRGEGVSTVFSAPMYTTHSNRGGVLLVRGDGGVDPLGYDAAPQPAVVNSAQAAVRRSCPYMPASLGDWARLSVAGQLPPPPPPPPSPSPLAFSTSLGCGSPSPSAFGARQRQSPPSPALASPLRSPRKSPFWRPQQHVFGAGFDRKEALALRAMSGGGETITADSLFAFDDSFGDGRDCLHAATVLKTLCPRVGGRGEAGGRDGGAATMYDFLRVAGALKALAAVREAEP
eukprot:g5253.t1